MPPVGNPRVAAALAALLGSDVGADCEVRFRLDTSPLAGRKRQADGAIQQPSNEALACTTCIGDPLPGHSLVLRFASSVFGAEFGSWAPEGESSGELPAQRRVLNVSVRSAADVPAARAAIGFAYTGEVDAASIRKALKVWQQGAYLGIDGCGDACLDVVVAKLQQAAAVHPSAGDAGGSSGGGAGGGSGGGAGCGTGGGSGGSSAGAGSTLQAELPAALELYLNEPLWPDTAEAPRFAAILEDAKPQLVAHFGDALTTLNTYQLRKQLALLPSAGLEALLESETFGTDSESTMLHLTTCWMCMNFHRTGPEVRLQLCRHLRLSQLSRSYLCWILPLLAADHDAHGIEPAGWFPVGSWEANLIRNYATANNVERARLLKCSIPAGGCKLYDQQSPWYTLNPRPQHVRCVTGERIFPWSISREELESALRSAQPGKRTVLYGNFNGGGVKCVYARGYDLLAKLDFDVGKEVGGVFLSILIPGSYRRLGGVTYNNCGMVGTVTPAASLSVHCWTAEGTRQVAYKVTSDATAFMEMVSGFGSSSALRLPKPPKDAGAAAGVEAGGGMGPAMSAWAQYLRDGKVTGELTLLPLPSCWR